jgi:hypothetical protein
MRRCTCVSLRLLSLTLVAFLSLSSVLCSRKVGWNGRHDIASSQVEDDVTAGIDGRREAIGEGGATLISTKSGKLQGFRTNNTIAFLGVPYAYVQFNR